MGVWGFLKNVLQRISPLRRIRREHLKQLSVAVVCRGRKVLIDIGMDADNELTELSDRADIIESLTLLKFPKAAENIV